MSEQENEETTQTASPTEAYEIALKGLSDQFVGQTPRLVKGVRPNMLNRPGVEGLAGTRALEAKGVSLAGAQFLAERAQGQYWLGPGLVDAEGFIASNEYDLDVDPTNILTNMTKEQRKLWAKEADRIGFYGGSNPSSIITQTGESFSNADVLAMQVFLRASNLQGVTFSVLFSQMQQMASAAVKGTAVKVTAPEDIAYYFRQQWLNAYGTMPTKQKIDEAIKGYQQMERQAAARSQQAPSVTTGTRALAMDLGKPEQRGGTLVGRAVQRAFRVLGGGAQ
jgi:hypothetical protein